MPNMPEIIFTVGVSGSGKTTWAEQFCKDNPSYINVNRDDIRRELFNFGKWSEYKFTKERERKVSEQQLYRIETALSLMDGVVVSDTNLSKERCIELIKKVEEKFGRGVSFTFKVFDVDPIKCIEYDLKRNYPVGAKVIMEQYQKFSDNWLIPEYAQDGRGLPSAIIIDIDGTVAQKTNERGHFDWTKVELDLPRQHVIDLVVSAATMGYTPIFMSGRDAVCREQTMNWIEMYIPELSGAQLFMRPNGDMRPDTVVKAELFEENVRGKYNVVMAFDDRPGICCLWRYKFGINVINVSDKPFHIF